MRRGPGNPFRVEIERKIELDVLYIRDAIARPLLGACNRGRAFVRAGRRGMVRERGQTVDEAGRYRVDLDYLEAT